MDSFFFPLFPLFFPLLIESTTQGWFSTSTDSLSSSTALDTMVRHTNVIVNKLDTLNHGLLQLLRMKRKEVEQEDDNKNKKVLNFFLSFSFFQEYKHLSRHLFSLLSNHSMFSIFFFLLLLPLNQHYFSINNFSQHPLLSPLSSPLLHAPPPLSSSLLLLSPPSSITSSSIP